jgi:2Fe-2S ferredoxin
MEAAVARNVPGVVGECGGNLSCATCHVQVAEDWAARVGGPEAFEDAMLDTVEAARGATSRLSCQIKARADLDGLVLIVPAI